MDFPISVEGVCLFLHLMSHEMGALVAFSDVRGPTGDTELRWALGGDSWCGPLARACLQQAKSHVHACWGTS